MAQVDTKDRQAELAPGVHPVFQTGQPGFHFFGYYDKSPFDMAGRRLLAHRVNFDAREVQDGDEATVGYWDLETGKFHEIGRTKAFNWQQGSMLQWRPPGNEKRVLYNDVVEGEYRAVEVDLDTGRRWTHPTTIYSVSPKGRYAVTPDYKRLAFCRPGYNYQNVRDERWNAPCPEGDGIHLLDLNDKTAQLVIPTRQVMNYSPLPSMLRGDNYLEHLMFNPSGDRFVFFHRWQLADGGVATRLYSAAPSGGNLHLFPDSLNYSHGCWRSGRELLIYGRRISTASKFRNSRGLLRLLLQPLLRLNRMLPHTKAVTALRSKVSSMNFLLLKDGTQQSETIGDGELIEDGHCAFRPGNRDHVLIDSYPDADCRQYLFIYDIKSQVMVPLADLYCPAAFHNCGFRCDLHPRWDRSGGYVCVDSLQTGERQMYVYDVREALRGL